MHMLRLALNFIVTILQFQKSIKETVSSVSLEIEIFEVKMNFNNPSCFDPSS
jgi:hypothetical protein